jgi:hypothetical protein
MARLENYEFTLQGRMPILMHSEDILGADRVKAWRRDPLHKNTDKGDDRHPPWTWVTYLYVDAKGFVGIPQTILIKMLVEAGKSFKMPGSSRKTLKGAVAALVQFDQITYPLTFDGDKQVNKKEFEKIVGMDTFEEQLEEVEKFGFTVDMRRVRVTTNKHIRTRPYFHNWSIAGRIRVDNSDGTIGKETVEELFNYAGRFQGICDYRPGASNPGPFGTFDATVKRIKG